MADHTDFRSDFSSTNSSSDDSDDSNGKDKDDIGDVANDYRHDDNYDMNEKGKKRNLSKFSTKAVAAKSTATTKPIAIKAVATKRIDKQSKKNKKIEKIQPQQQQQSSSIYDDVALVCNDEVLYIEEEKVVFLTTDKNSKIYLPKLDSESPSKTSKGSLFLTKTVKIKATRLGYEHNIFSYKGNYINAGSIVYNLKGGSYVTFYAAGNMWYTMD